MAVSTIGVDDAVTPDKYLHTWSRTISGTAREDQFTLPGQAVYPTYSVTASTVSGAVATAHLFQIMADGTNYSRLKSLRVWSEVATSATADRFDLYRLSSAGTGGTAITAVPYDTADTYAGAAAYTPSSKGTEETRLMTFRLVYPAANGTPGLFEWFELPGAKPIIFGTATSSGIALKNATNVTGAYVSYVAEFITTSFL